MQRKQKNNADNKNTVAQKRVNQTGKVKARVPAAGTGNNNSIGLQGQVRKPAAAKIVNKPAQTAKKNAANPSSKSKQTQIPNGRVKRQQNQLKNGSQAGSKPQQQKRRPRRKNTGVAAGGKGLKRRRKNNKAEKAGGIVKQKPVGNNNGAVKNAKDLKTDDSEDEEEAEDIAEAEDLAEAEDIADGEATKGEDSEVAEGEGEVADYGGSENDNSADEGVEYDDEYYYNSEDE